MSYKAFFDTNILAYEFERKDLDKREVAKKLLEKWRPSGNMVISVQVLQELYVVLTRKMGVPEEDAAKVIESYARLPVIETDVGLVLHGVEISRRYKISFWDSLIVAAAIRGNCRVIFSEDMAHKMKIEGVEVVNPFS